MGEGGRWPILEADARCESLEVTSRDLPFQARRPSGAC